MAILDLLDYIIGGTQGIYNQVQLIKANKIQSQRLYERIAIVTQTLQQLDDIKINPERYEKGLIYLKKCIDEICEFIQKFAQKKWFKRVINAGNDSDTFKELNDQLQVAAGLLNLGVVTQQIVNREIDKQDAAKDSEALAALQEEIIKLHQESLDELQVIKNNQDYYNQIVMNQVTSLRAYFAEVCKGNASESLPIPKYLIINYFNLVFNKMIGEGSFAKVFLGTWGVHDAVAIKELKLLDGPAREQFIIETQIMSRLHSPYIVQLYGACLEPGRECLVMEYMPKGSLNEYLQKQSLTLPERKQLALDLAKGLRTLHTLGVIHRDLKSANVLLTQEGRIKLSDFGLSKVRSASIATAHQSSMAIPWMAPELFKREKLTKKVDIYSYGMILWEIMTGKKPYVGMKETEIEEHVKAGRREQLTEEISEACRVIIKACWEANPDRRPSTKLILQQLEAWQLANPEVLYQKGLKAESKRDYENARQYYHQSGELDYTRGWCNYGMLLLQGKGGVLDKTRAFQLIQKAAESGLARAQYNLGVILERGDGVPSDPERACFWFKKAADQGNKQALSKYHTYQLKTENSSSFNSVPFFSLKADSSQSDTSSLGASSSDPDRKPNLERRF